MRWAPLATCALAACAPRVDVPAVPEGVSWLGWIETEAGSVTQATPLAPYAADAPFAVYADPGPGRYVLGYRSETLAPVTAEVAPEAFAGAPLVAPAACAARLPAPDWWVGFDEDGAPVDEAPAPVPELGAPWLAGVCPSIAADGLFLEISCLPAPCAQARLTEPCGAEIDLSACGLEPLVLTRDLYGGACATPPAAWSCAPAADAPADAMTALDCTLPVVEGARACRVTAYARTPARPLELDGVVVDRRALVEDPRFEPPGGLVRFSHVDPDELLEGVATGLAVDDRGDVWVARFEDGQARDCHTPDNAPVTRLERFDPDTLEPVGSSTAPPCLQAMIADPGPGRVLGLHVEGDGWALSRFDAAGRAIGTTPLPDAGPVRAVWAAGLLPAPDRAGLIAAVARDAPRERVDVFELRVEDLQVVGRRAVDGASTHRVARVPSGPLLAGLRGDDRWLARLDLDDPARDVRVPLERPLLRDNVAFTDVAHHAATGLDAYALSRDMTSVRLLADAGQTSTTYFERATQAMRLAPWPADPRRLAHLGLSRAPGGRWETLLYLVDPARRRLVPGHRVVGEGVATAARVDAAGRLWVLLGWTAELVRVTPAVRR